MRHSPRFERGTESSLSPADPDARTRRYGPFYKDETIRATCHHCENVGWNNCVITIYGGEWGCWRYGKCTRRVSHPRYRTISHLLATFMTLCHHFSQSASSMLGNIPSIFRYKLFLPLSFSLSLATSKCSLGAYFLTRELIMRRVLPRTYSFY